MKNQSFIEWIAFAVVVLIILGAIIGIYLKKRKGETIHYNVDDDNGFDDMMNLPE